MDQMPPMSRPSEADAQGPTSNSGEGSSDAPVVPPLPSLGNGDDNTRSPKRRRISQEDGQQDVKAEAERSNSQNPTASTGQPTALDSQAQNVPAKPPPQQQAHDVAKPASDTAQPQDAPIPPPPHQARIVVTRPQQQPTPPRISLLEHLPALDRQASQILTFLSRLTPAEAMGLSNNPGAASSREYASLRAVFDRTRRLLSPGWPFLPQHDLGLRDNNELEIVRRANQAIFMSSIFTGEIGLRDMDRSFLAVFVPENGSLLPAQGSMYLELKTQGFITAWRTGAAPPDLVMQDMFGPDVDKMLLARRPGTTELTDVERDFLRLLNSRRGILESAVNTKTLDQLPVSYKWEDFSREVSSYLITYIVRTPGDIAGATSEHDGLQAQGSSSLYGGSIGEAPVKEDFVALAAAAADFALRSTLGLSLSDPIPDMPSSTPSAAAPVSTVQRAKSTPHTATSPEDTTHSEATTVQGPTSSEQKATGSTNGRKSSEDNEEQLAVENTISIPGEKSGGGQAIFANGTNKPVLPSKPEVEAITPPSDTDAGS
ncbi:TTAGGG repeat binding factor [Cladophialophora chaetospira]|uniref:TTAGGG repeat binding factor n=1 Tax=Cladophialophora chaetospira TaxID=386627 RepID=A0AA38XHF1_9EURO|nr:TTAGGG repeat binding factor [Cladophialophora chaetospira]